MRVTARIVPMLLVCGIAACNDNSTNNCCTTDQGELRIVNAFTSSVNVAIDGTQVTSALAAGAIQTFPVAAGSHGLSVNGGAGSFVGPVTVANGALSTLAVVRNASGNISSAVLDDTNSVVPAGATKLRVLHLAPNAGTLQVYRTQPDFQQPVAWRTPFNYEPSPTSQSAPFIQSTVGTWEVRIWQTPADASGWSSATVKVVVPLGDGQKRTILILDKPGGGVRTEVI